MAISSLSGSSFASLNQSSVSGMRPKSAADLLGEMDADQSGKVSKSEFAAFGEKLKTQGPKPPTTNSATAKGMPSADELFDKADANADSSISVDELSSMIAQAETQRSADGPGGSGKAGPPPGGGGPPPGGGGPPPGGGMSGASSAKSSSSSSASTSSTDDPADANGDGTVSAAEKLLYATTQSTESSGTSGV